MFKYRAALLAAAVGCLMVASAAQADPPLELRSNGGRAGMPTFSANFTGYTAYATPTDLFGICGAANKTIVVVAAYLNMQSTAAALQNISWIKRSTADASGTPTTVAGIPHDTHDGITASAVVKTYAAAPTLGTTIGTLRTSSVLSGTLTAAPGIADFYAPPFHRPDASLFSRPVTLNSASECLYANYGGGALTSGFTSIGGFVWAEYRR
jgi:hypothetical protein